MSPNKSGADAAESEHAPELWTRLAWLPLLALVASVLYLGVRPGGTGPIFVYMTGRLLIGLSSLVLFIWGLVVGVLHRPLIRRERLRAFVIIVSVLSVSNYPFPYPSSREGRPSRVEFRLPVEGEWVVLWGGERKEVNRLVGFYPDQRWGMHLVRVLEGSAHPRYRGDGAKAGDHYCHGERVFAPAAGEVVRVVDGIDDDAALTASSEPFGNHLVIEVAGGEFLFLTQLLAGSLTVASGDRVESGDLLGRVGASGVSPVSPAPHLGLHLATSPIPGQGEGIPWAFHGYTSAGAFVDAGLPAGGVASDGGCVGARVSHAGPQGGD